MDQPLIPGPASRARIVVARHQKSWGAAAGVSWPWTKRPALSIYRTDSRGPDLVGIWRPVTISARLTFALDAMTGKILWGFQIITITSFDQDTMAPPVPVELQRWQEVKGHRADPPSKA